MKEARAFSPGHITGFFQICDEVEDPLQKGSRGAGVSLSQGVTTTVKVDSAVTNQRQITINDKTTRRALVSERVLDYFLKFVDGSFRIEVKHSVTLPIGSGFGTSGAGALSLAFALNKALDLELSNIKAAQIAHIVEVECLTGLGTVIAETVGGIEIRVQAGGPGVGQVQTLAESKDHAVVCLPFGSIPTSTQLSDDKMRQRINDLGGKLTDALQSNPTVPNFLTYSRQFAEYTQILTTRVAKILKAADRKGWTCSSAIFGENVFTIVPQNEQQEVTEFLRRYAPLGQDVLIMDIDYEGARLLHE